MGVDPAALNKGCPAVANGGSCPKGGCTFTGRIDSRAAAGSVGGGKEEESSSFCATCTLKTPGATSCAAFARNGGSSVDTVERGGKAGKAGKAGGAPPLSACDAPSSSTVASASLIEEEAAAARVAGGAAGGAADGRRAQRMRRRLQATSVENIDANGES